MGSAALAAQRKLARMKKSKRDSTGRAMGRNNLAHRRSKSEAFRLSEAAHCSPRLFTLETGMNHLRKSLKSRNEDLPREPHLSELVSLSKRAKSLSFRPFRLFRRPLIPFLGLLFLGTVRLGVSGCRSRCQQRRSDRARSRPMAPTKGSDSGRPVLLHPRMTRAISAVARQARPCGSR
jgi:hypothetical protein